MKPYIWKRFLVRIGLRDEFLCLVCNKSCDVAWDNGAICPECCSKVEDGHSYTYDRDQRGYYCEFCGKQAPYDYHDRDYRDE